MAKKRPNSLPTKRQLRTRLVEVTEVRQSLHLTQDQLLAAIQMLYPNTKQATGIFASIHLDDYAELDPGISEFSEFSVGVFWDRAPLGEEAQELGAAAKKGRRNKKSVGRSRKERMES
jgi:hypothetical protein